MPEKYIGETMANEAENAIGRIIEIPLTTLTNDYSKIHIKVQFQIVEISLKLHMDHLH